MDPLLMHQCCKPNVCFDKLTSKPNITDLDMFEKGIPTQIHATLYIFNI